MGAAYLSKSKEQANLKQILNNTIKTMSYSAIIVKHLSKQKRKGFEMGGK